jgi:hypothetical protein
VFEGLLYGVLVTLAFASAIVPHIVDYGWAWGWPLAGWGFPLALLSSVVVLVCTLVATLNAVRQPQTPRVLAHLRVLLLPVLFFGPGLLFGWFGGLARSQGHGLADRLERSTPLDVLQAWAARAMESSRGESGSSLPEAVARRLPPNPRVLVKEDHVTVTWYDRGVLIGGGEYHPPEGYFFLRRVRPGVFVYVVEH